MAGTIAATVRKRISLGGTTYAYFGTLTPDTSYATNGDTISAPAAPNLTLPEKLDFIDVQGSTGGHVATYDPVAGKVKIFEGAAGVLKEIANAANISTETFAYMAVGS